jgi:hypothetical protein
MTGLPAGVMDFLINPLFTMISVDLTVKPACQSQVDPVVKPVSQRHLIGARLPKGGSRPRGLLGVVSVKSLDHDLNRMPQTALGVVKS